MLNQPEDEIRVSRLTQQSIQEAVSALSEDSEIAIKGAELQSLKASPSSNSRNYFNVERSDPIAALEAKFKRQLDGVRGELDGVRGELDGAKIRILKLEGKVEAFAGYTWIEGEHLKAKKRHLDE